MLMDIVWIGVISAGTCAKAMAFMYSEVVTPTASSRHNRVLEKQRASTGGKRCASCVVLAMSYCQVSSIFGWKNVFTSLLSGHRSGDQIMCQNKSRVLFICLPWVVFVRPKLGHVIGGKPVDMVHLKLQLQVHR